MNRVVFTILEKGTSVQAKELEKLHDPKPFQTAYVSEKFPVYPIVICMYLENPPFNKFSLCFQENFYPSKGTLYGSEDGHIYVKLDELRDLGNREEYVKIFSEKKFHSYIRLILEEPTNEKQNICRQIKIKGIQFSMVKFVNSHYVCCLHSKLSYHPILYRLLEVLQYKSLLLRDSKSKLYEKYESRLAEIIRLIDQKKVNKLSPSQESLDKWKQDIAYFQNEPVYQQELVSGPDPVKVKKDIYHLQKQLRESEINNFGEIKPHVQQYFSKYHNESIKDGYLRYLSSNLQQDYYSALINFWNEVKELKQISAETEQAILMYFNYYLEFIQSPLKTAAVKTLILFSRINKNPNFPELNKVYQRLLFNDFRMLYESEDEQLKNLALKYCYILYDRVENKTFLDQLLHAYKGYNLEQQIQMLQILEKITFRKVEVLDREEIVRFLVDLLLTNQLKLTEKNRAYNIAAYLASIYGKSALMKDFQKLNAMILMTMEKNIDNKLGKIQKGSNLQEETQSCQYCGLHNKNFKDENLYDLHLAKQCKFLATCNFCGQNVQIPQLFKHYIEQCEHKHEFKHCDNCFEVILAKDEQKHNQKCPHKLETRCPLCYERVENKLKLKQHILTEGCPNNPR